MKFKCGIITIGDEILIGQVTDSNSARMAQLLGELGISIIRKWTVGDRKEDILYAMHEASQFCNLVLITGGLGPTKDDITKFALAEYTKCDLIFNEQAWNHLSELLTSRNVPLRDPHREQCFLPSKASLLHNALGTAPGLWITHENVLYIAMPGVPYEMEYILKESAIPRLKAEGYTDQYRQLTLNTAGMGETEIAHLIEPILANRSQGIDIAYLPSIGTVRLRLSANLTPVDALEAELNDLGDQIIGLLGKHYMGSGNTDLAVHIGALLRKKGLKLSTAESCTGGNISRMITQVPGASDYFIGSVVSYASSVKKSLLSVSEETLELEGVVSEKTAREMVIGVCKLLKTDLAISATGYAGPDGGTAEVPVGTIWLAAGNENQILTRKIQWGNDRLRNIDRAAIAGMLLARDWLLQNT